MPITGSCRAKEAFQSALDAFKEHLPADDALVADLESRLVEINKYRAPTWMS
jgi:hypothetical protein